MDKISDSDCIIYIGSDVFPELENFISKGKFSSIFILADENTNKSCLPILLEHCERLKQALLIEIPSGEDEKSLTTSAKIISILLENNADRKSLLVNVGGGVIGDLGGFIASVYKRGIRFINIPTTLLSMADASVGGKNGINFLDKKNIIGTFIRPMSVFVYPTFLKTLDQRQTRSGYAEIIKHILLSDNSRWNSIKSDAVKFLDENSREELITYSIKFKSEIVSNDFKEDGNRAILNFGHTIGHAIESFYLDSEKPLTHGESVAAGMISEIYLSNKFSKFPQEEMNQVIGFIRKVFNDLFLNCNPEDLIPFLYADKKNSHDKIGFSLLKSPGAPAGIVYPPIEDIVESLIFLKEEFSRTIFQ